MFECVRNLIDEIKPLAVIQGHVHDLAGKQFLYHGQDFISLFSYPGPNGGTLTIDEEKKTVFFEQTEDDLSSLIRVSP